MVPAVRVMLSAWVNTYDAAMLPKNRLGALINDAVCRAKFVLVYRHTSSQFEPYRSVARESKYTRIERRANYRNEARVVASERTLGATAHEGGGGTA